ncbi:MAG: DUF4162 domain-containing protein, partial [Blastocatellia bacterium]
LRVHCDNVDEIADVVLDALTATGANITRVERQEPSLEDAFIALTDGRLN